MPYRNICDGPELGAKREMTVTSSHSDFNITNGTISYLAIPCFYVEILPPVQAPHCRTWHDHVGQPSPAHPDHICQAWDYDPYHADHLFHHHRYGHYEPYIDMSRTVPIHLQDEGYERTRVVLYDGAPEGLTVTSWFDDEQDWVVRVRVDANMQSAYATTKIIPFSVFADGYFDEKVVTSILQRGRFIVLPAII